MSKSARAEEAIALIKSDPSKTLSLAIGPHPEVTPGQFIPKAEAQEPPKLSFRGASGHYIAVEIDLDAPFVSFPILGPILHWVQSGLAASESGALESDTPVIASYAPPGPPPISGPHRYVVLLYEQPADFRYQDFAPADGKPLSIPQRMRYDIKVFEKAASLGPVVAANYYTSK